MRYNHTIIQPYNLTNVGRDPGVPGVRSMGPVVSNKMCIRGFADLTDVILADEDNYSIPTDDVN